MRRNVSLKQLTTFQIGGNAEVLWEVATEDDLCTALDYADEKKLPVTILAGGSNVLVPDEGLAGVVIRWVPGAYIADGLPMHIPAGVGLLHGIRTAATAGYGGWEQLAGIPGSIGGAVRGNAGAFGTEMQDVVVSVTAINIHTRARRVFTNNECDFAYRSSFFKKHTEWVITSALVQLHEANPRVAHKCIADTIIERERRHIQDVRAAGSFFVNPVVSKEIQRQFETEKGVATRGGRVPAGWLIERAGMRGVAEGGACMSVQHANYLVNHTGEATAAEVCRLASRIKDAVHKESGVVLTEEVTLL